MSIEKNRVDPHDKGWYADATALNAAWPSALAGDFATVGSGATGTVVYTWDTGTSVWENTDSSGFVTSVFGRTSAVTAQNGDYTAAQVGAISTSDAAANNTWCISEIIDGGNFALKVASANNKTFSGNNPVSISSVAHGLNTGDQIVISSTSAAAALPTGIYPVTRTSADAFTVPFNGTGVGGTCSYDLTVKGIRYLPAKFTITGWTLRGDQSGALTVEIYYAPTYNGTFVEITGGGISIVSGNAATDGVGAFGTTVLAQHGVLKYAIISNAGLHQNVSIELAVTKTV